jgi:hypothetical protein
VSRAREEVLLRRYEQDREEGREPPWQPAMVGCQTPAARILELFDTIRGCRRALTYMRRAGWRRSGMGRIEAALAEAAYTRRILTERRRLDAALAELEHIRRTQA